MPIALIEAQMAGIPVVATNVGSVSEVVVDGKTGFISDKSVNELVFHLRTIISNKELLTEMGHNAKNHAIKAFSTSAMIQKHIDLYRLIA